MRSLPRWFLTERESTCMQHTQSALLCNFALSRVATYQAEKVLWAMAALADRVGLIGG